VAYTYIDCDREQLFLLPPSMLDWLPEDDLAYFVIDAVKLLDTSVLHARYQDGPGRPAYHPDMMLSVMMYAYCMGVRSSRAIERACQRDISYRVITANKTPDHTTIARFRADNEAEMETIFIEVLKLCARAGLASLGRIAIDGTKIGSDAALDANRELDSIRAEIKAILAEASDADAKEDAEPQFLDASLPERFAKRGSRLQHLQAALAEAEAEEEAARAKLREALDKQMAAADAGRKMRGRKPEEPHAGLIRAEADHRAAEVQAASHPYEPEYHEALRQTEADLEKARAAAAAAPKEKITVNVTDPESRVMKTQTGWVQGYNVQASTNENQVVFAYAATTDHNDVNQLLPMIGATQHNATAAGITERIGLALLDAGYWSDENATADGPDRLIATTKDWKQRQAARELGTTEGPPPEDASPLEAMEHRLRTKEGAAAYATRSYTVEPVFGDVKENHGFRRFMRRGQRAAQAEAGLIFTTHNLMKIFCYNPSVVFGVT